MHHVQRICFVCLGNICRSPLAQGVAEAMAAERNLELVIESAGTGGWHVGNPPDRRMQQTAKRQGIDLSSQRAAQLHPTDIERFDLFVVMDRSNHMNAREILGPDADIKLLLDFHDGPETEVPDPYYGGDDGFEQVFQLVSSAMAGLLDRIESNAL